MSDLQSDHGWWGQDSFQKWLKIEEGVRKEHFPDERKHLPEQSEDSEAIKEVVSEQNPSKYDYSWYAQPNFKHQNWPRTSKSKINGKSKNEETMEHIRK